MAMNINTNIPSLNAQRNLSRSQSTLNNSLQRLSSGLRINSAKDDAAGLAISNRMTSQIRGLDQAVRNANDGISLAQTAEGALQESGNILQRIRELAVQASSDGSTDADRASMQVEVDQLISELDRIATTTSFNGKVLLDGSFGTGNFQVGANAGQTVSMTMASARTNALGASSIGTATGSHTMAKETSSDGTLVSSGEMATLGTGSLSINGTEIRAALSGDDTLSSSDNAGSALAIAAAINESSDKTGVTAHADKTEIEVAVTVHVAGDLELAGDDFKINGVSITTSGALADVDALAALVNEFSDQTGVTASNAAGNVTFTAVDGRNIQFESDGSLTAGTGFGFAGTELTTDAFDKTVRGNVSLYSNSSFTIGGTSPSTAGFTAGTVALDETHWTDTGTLETLSAGDLVINGYSVIAPSADTDGYSQSAVDTSASAKAIAYAINNTDGLKNEVTASAKTVANLGKVSSYADASTDFVLEINGVAQTFDQAVKNNDSDGYLVGTLNTVFSAAAADTAQHGLVASINDNGELIITSETGVNIDINVTTAADTSVFSNIDITTTDTDVVHKGTVSLSATTGNTISSIEGGKQALAGIETAVGTIENVDISTYSGAQNAITAVDGALSQIDDQRAELGAIQNRFDSTIANLSTTSENLSAAKARIMDADFAMETANMTKAQILQQAGTAMLAQANQLPQQVLSLLQ